MRAFKELLSFLSISALLGSLTDAHEHVLGKRGARRHRDVNALESFNHTLSKRFDNVRYSNYDITTGEVACGGFYQPSDFVCTTSRGDIPSY